MKDNEWIKRRKDRLTYIQMGVPTGVCMGTQSDE